MDATARSVGFVGWLCGRLATMFCSRFLFTIRWDFWYLKNPGGFFHPKMNGFDFSQRVSSFSQDLSDLFNAHGVTIEASENYDDFEGCIVSTSYYFAFGGIRFSGEDCWSILSDAAAQKSLPQSQSSIYPEPS